MPPEKRIEVMVLEILTNQISESSALIIAACVLLSAGAMVFDTLFEHRRSEKPVRKTDPGCAWNNGSEGIDPEGVPFSGLEPLPELMEMPVISPDGVPCLDGDGFIRTPETVSDIQYGHGNGDEGVARHGLA